MVPIAEARKWRHIKKYSKLYFLPLKARGLHLTYQENLGKSQTPAGRRG